MPRIAAAAPSCQTHPSTPPHPPRPHPAPAPQRRVHPDGLHAGAGRRVCVRAAVPRVPAQGAASIAEPDPNHCGGAVNGAHADAGGGRQAARGVHGCEVARGRRAVERVAKRVAGGGRAGGRPRSTRAPCSPVSSLPLASFHHARRSSAEPRLAPPLRRAPRPRPAPRRRAPPAPAPLLPAHPLASPRPSLSPAPTPLRPPTTR